MPADRPWYREPESFVALAALVVSISAVVVGIYEASLQRAHDRAEVWPHVEITTFTTSTGASLFIQNSGLGPAVIKSVRVTVDGVPRHDWPDALGALLGTPPTGFPTSTVVERGIRAGDKVEMVSLSRAQMPRDFWRSVSRVSITVCYESVFGQAWEVSDSHLGGTSVWRDVDACPNQPAGIDF